MRFLILDADKERILLRYLLEYFPNHTIEEAGTIADATNLLQKSEPFDAILMGLRLPNGRGEEAFLRVFKAAAPCPIVIYSERTEDTEEELRRLVAFGASGYVWKGSVDAKQLLGELIFAAVQSRHSARLTQEEVAAARAAEEAVNGLRRTALRSDPPMAEFSKNISDALHAIYMMQRQTMASMATHRHSARSSDMRHDHALSTDRQNLEDIANAAEKLEKEHKQTKRELLKMRVAVGVASFGAGGAGLKLIEWLMSVLGG